jgi:Asp-tRNA(Asn)/Glu-tRNA(Gln) amidotransferase A subunit family amidase
MRRALEDSMDSKPIHTLSARVLARRRFLAAIPAALAGTLAAPAAARQEQTPRIGKPVLDCAEKIFALDFTDAEEEAAATGVNQNLEAFEKLRNITIPLDTEPAVTFRPWLPGRKPKPGATPGKKIKVALQRPSARPSSLEDLAFLPITALAPLLERRVVSATELTTMYLERLKRYGPKLNCVVTLTESLALAQAAEADREIRTGHYKGPLHGIPWGAKDLFATKGVPTTWGASPFKNQIFDYDATIVERLRNAGAILVAKLSMGALAQGDRWFGGQTKNPWNPEDSSPQRSGASGSSAGPGSATAAGLVAFGIGTETRGSIISPSSANGVTGLRPTYGRVSRYGAMALAWTMDKIGPMCRSVEDCALVFNAIYGPDGRDETVTDAPFAWSPTTPLSALRIGYIQSEFSFQPPAAGAAGRGATPGTAGRGASTPGTGPAALTDRQREARVKIFADVLDVYRKAGATLEPVDIPAAITNIAGVISFVLATEGATAFDDLTRSAAITDPSLNNWPNSFRTHRFVPAVEYLRAQRARTLLMREMDTLMARYDVLLSPTGSATLGVTNLTGHPALALKAGFVDNAPVELMLTGRLYDEATLLRTALAFERGTDWHTRNPTM